MFLLIFVILHIVFFFYVWILSSANLWFFSLFFAPLPSAPLFFYHFYVMISSIFSCNFLHCTLLSSHILDIYFSCLTNTNSLYQPLLQLSRRTNFYHLHQWQFLPLVPLLPPPLPPTLVPLFRRPQALTVRTLSQALPALMMLSRNDAWIDDARKHRSEPEW